jgi:hypothetical protein
LTRRLLRALRVIELGLLTDLLRVVQQRLIRGGLVMDVVLVELLCDQKATIRQLPSAIAEAADEIMAAWLALAALAKPSFS